MKVRQSFDDERGKLEDIRKKRNGKKEESRLNRDRNEKGSREKEREKEAFDGILTTSWHSPSADFLDVAL